MEGGRVGFEVDFFQLRKVENIAQTSEEVAEVFLGEERRSAAAEIDGAEGAMTQAFVVMLSLGEEGVDEGGEVGLAWGVLVEGAVGADLVTKRKMEIEAERGWHGGFLTEEGMRESLILIKSENFEGFFINEQ